MTKVILSGQRLCRVLRTRWLVILCCMVALFAIAGCGGGGGTLNSRSAKLVVKLNDSILPTSQAKSSETEVARIKVNVYKVNADKEIGDLYTTRQFSITTNREVTISVTDGYEYIAVFEVTKPNGELYGTFSVVASFVDAVKNDTVEVEAPLVLEPAGAKLLSITVEPSNTNNHAGNTQQFVAKGVYDNGLSIDITGAVLWSSSETKIVAIQEAASSSVKGGLASLLMAGKSKITAVYPGASISGTVEYEVVAEGTVVSIAITPQTESLSLGESVSLKATATYATGDKVDVTSAVAWNSSNKGVAVFSEAAEEAGLLQAIAVGTTQITAEHKASGISSPSLSLTVVTPVEATTLTMSHVWAPESLNYLKGVKATVAYVDGAAPKETVDVNVPSDFLTSKSLDVVLHSSAATTYKITSIVLTTEHYANNDGKQYAFEWWNNVDGVLATSTDPNAFDIAHNTFAGGEGTQTNPYLVGNPRQLTNVEPESADAVGYYKQCCDIDFSNSSGLSGKLVVNAQRKDIAFDVLNDKARFYNVPKAWIEDGDPGLSAPKGTYTCYGWNPIGAGLMAGGWGNHDTYPITSRNGWPFRGEYDGAGYIIDGLMCNSTYVMGSDETTCHRHSGVSSALFGVAIAATISNVTIGDNCFFRAESGIPAFAAGIVGHTEYAEPTGHQYDDDMRTVISCCLNEGSVYAKSSKFKTAVGGMIGWAHPANVEYCTNRGTIISLITGKTGDIPAQGGNINYVMGVAGGLVGYCLDIARTDNSGRAPNAAYCKNEGSVYSYRDRESSDAGDGYAFAGGIFGYMYDAVAVDCTNTASTSVINTSPAGVTASENLFCGGITGELQLVNATNPSWSTLKRCANRGPVTVKTASKASIMTGGLAGFCELTGAYHEGVWSANNIEECVSTGDVNVVSAVNDNAQVSAGGLVGCIEKDKPCCIKDSYCVANLSTSVANGNYDSVYMGGLIGYRGCTETSTNKVTLTSCYSNSHSANFDADKFGGVFGSLGGKVECSKVFHLATWSGKAIPPDGRVDGDITEVAGINDEQFANEQELPDGGSLKTALNYDGRTLWLNNAKESFYVPIGYSILPYEQE